MSTAIQQQANKALLDSIRRLGVGKRLVGDQVCVIQATLGVDTLPAGSAPGGESVRVYVNTDHPDTFCLLALAAYLGIAQPLVKSAMEFVTVLKHRQQPLKILPLVPSHADGLNVLAHGEPLVSCEAAIVSQHTPGPWRAQEWSCHAATTIISGDTDACGDQFMVIAECAGQGRDADHCLANARLIAAAPDLLAACQALIAHCDKNPPMGDSLWSVQLIRDAIAKATQAQAEVAA